MSSILQAAITEVKGRIHKLESLRCPWYQFSMRRELRGALENYRLHLSFLYAQEGLEILQRNERPVLDANEFNPENREHVVLVDLLASPATFDS